MQQSLVQAPIYHKSVICALLQVEIKIPKEAVPKVSSCDTCWKHMQAGISGVAKNCQAEENMGPWVLKNKDSVEILLDILEVGKE